VLTEQSADTPRLACTRHFTNLRKRATMSGLLYIVAVILIILWAIGFVGYHVGGLIHILLLIALIAVILRVIQGRRAI